MFRNWLNRLLGIVDKAEEVAEVVVETAENVVEEVVEAVEEIVEDVQLASLTKAQLLDLAKERGVEVKASWKKADIIAALDT